jgi:quinol monooxygenase YgiN
MVMTILEARVSRENWQALEHVYQQGAQQREPGLVQSFLIHSKKEADLWRIVTIWSSQEALDAMRGTGETPRGVLMFRLAQAEPALSVYEIAGQISQ